MTFALQWRLVEGGSTIIGGGTVQSGTERGPLHNLDERGGKCPVKTAETVLVSLLQALDESPSCGVAPAELRSCGT